MQFKTNLMSIIVALCILSSVVGFSINEGFAGEPQKVVGKATIKASVELTGVLMIRSGQFAPFRFASFKKQTMYIIDVVDAEDGTGNFYILDSSGFSNNCPVHGEEILAGGMIGVPQSQVDAGDVTIQMF